jgi:hypothetical protein
MSSTTFAVLPLANSLPSSGSRGSDSPPTSPRASSTTTEPPDRFAFAKKYISEALSSNAFPALSPSSTESSSTSPTAVSFEVPEAVQEALPTMVGFLGAKIREMKEMELDLSRKIFANNQISKRSDAVEQDKEDLSIKLEVASFSKELFEKALRECCEMFGADPESNSESPATFQDFLEGGLQELERGLKILRQSLELSKDRIQTIKGTFFGKDTEGKGETVKLTDRERQALKLLLKDPQHALAVNTAKMQIMSAYGDELRAYLQGTSARAIKGEPEEQSGTLRLTLENGELLQRVHPLTDRRAGLGTLPYERVSNPFKPRAMGAPRELQAHLLWQSAFIVTEQPGQSNILQLQFVAEDSSTKAQESTSSPITAVPEPVSVASSSLDEPVPPGVELPERGQGPLHQASTSASMLARQLPSVADVSASGNLSPTTSAADSAPLVTTTANDNSPRPSGTLQAAGGGGADESQSVVSRRYGKTSKATKRSVVVHKGFTGFSSKLKWALAFLTITLVVFGIRSIFPSFFLRGRARFLDVASRAASNQRIEIAVKVVFDRVDHLRRNVRANRVVSE